MGYILFSGFNKLQLCYTALIIDELYLRLHGSALFTLLENKDKSYQKAVRAAV